MPFLFIYYQHFIKNHIYIIFPIKIFLPLFNLFFKLTNQYYYQNHFYKLEDQKNLQYIKPFIFFPLVLKLN